MRLQNHPKEKVSKQAPSLPPLPPLYLSLSLALPLPLSLSLSLSLSLFLSLSRFFLFRKLRLAGGDVPAEIQRRGPPLVVRVGVALGLAEDAAGGAEKSAGTK